MVFCELKKKIKHRKWYRIPEIKFNVLSPKLVHYKNTGKRSESVFPQTAMESKHPDRNLLKGSKISMALKLLFTVLGNQLNYMPSSRTAKATVRPGLKK